jgi:2-hydroxy-3-oxopropionate reductase
VKIGFIGLGTMGKPMVRNLIEAGYTVSVYDRVAKAVNEMAAAGAAPNESCRKAAEASEAVITMVPDSPDVEAVVTGEDGVLAGMAAGGTIIDMSSISPSVTRHLAALCEERGIEYLDAPVSGGEPGAVAGTLSIMVGGKKDVFERFVPIFEVLGKSINYMGASGLGQTTKLCNQIICALNIQAVCEGLMLGACAGIDLEKLISVVSAGAAGSWMVSNLGPKIIKGDHEPGFKIKLQQKDLRLALDTAASLSLPLPGTGVVHQMFRAAEAAGCGEKGTQAAVTALEMLAGKKIYDA